MNIQALENRRKLNNVLLLSLLLLIRSRKKEKHHTRRFWVRDLLKRRKAQGAYHCLLQEMRLTDQEKYFNYLRMTSDNFHNLLSIVGPRINKLDWIREPISPGERLALTLRYLASGDSMVSVGYAFRIAPNTVSKIIQETCNVIWDTLNETQLLKPNEDSWLEIAEGFQERWQLPHCVGAMDGKHVIIQAPSKSGSSYYNYKGSHSIVLLAVCDAHYRFTLVDIGGEGRHSDGGIFKNSLIGRLINENSIKFPAPSPLGCDKVLINYFIAADEAFPLTLCLMRPYAGRFLTQQKRIFNYRLCRARRVIENVFGILASRWRIFRKPIIASDLSVVAIIKATVCLHNYLLNSEARKSGTEKRYFLRENELEICQDEGNVNLLPVKRTGTNMYSRNAEMMREELSRYFMNEGAVPFQWNK